MRVARACARRGCAAGVNRAPARYLAISQNVAPNREGYAVGCRETVRHRASIGSRPRRLSVG
jgi:hypothetical protein